MKYIIMCGGEYPYYETPRWLTEVCGEPIVKRTIRLLKENGVDDIAISTTHKGFKKFGVPILKHNNEFNAYKRESFWVDAFYPVDDPVCYIFGDVVFSPNAIKTIVDYSVDDVMFFASGLYSFSVFYTKPWAEPFAFKVKDVDYFFKCIEITKEYDRRKMFLRQPVSWELWQVIRNTTLNDIKYNYVGINDYTCDIDHPEDAEKIEEMIYKYELSTHHKTGYSTSKK